MTQTVPDISPLMPMHQDPLLVWLAEWLVWPPWLKIEQTATCRDVFSEQVKRNTKDVEEEAGPRGGTRSEKWWGCAAGRWKLDPKRSREKWNLGPKRSNSVRIGSFNTPKDRFGVGGWEKIPQKDRARSCQSEKRGSKPRHICITHHIGSTPPPRGLALCYYKNTRGQSEISKKPSHQYATHWRHRQRGWRHWHRRGHQPSPFLLATHWRHRQQGRPPAQSIPIGDALATSSTGLATLASTWPPAQSIPIGNALATSSTGAATSPVHCHWRRIGNIVNGVGDIGIDAATSSVHSYWRRIGDVVNSGGHQPGPLLLVTHWRHRQRGWRHWRRRGHQPSPFLLATHWRHRQRGWRHWHRRIHQPSPLPLATHWRHRQWGWRHWRPRGHQPSPFLLATHWRHCQKGLATLASTWPPAQSIPIGNALATSSTGVATSPVHCHWRRIGNIVNGVGDIVIDAATSSVHSYWRRIGDVVNSGGHQPGPLLLATHWRHRQRGWRHWRRRGHQPSPFLLATHWRHRQRGWRHWHRHIHQPSPLLLATHWRHRQWGWRHWRRRGHQPSPFLWATHWWHRQQGWRHWHRRGYQPIPFLLATHWQQWQRVTGLVTAIVWNWLFRGSYHEGCTKVCDWLF